jgi:hypothetical protein
MRLCRLAYGSYRSTFAIFLAATNQRAYNESA